MLSVSVDMKALEASRKEAEKVIGQLGETPARKTMIEAANAGLVNALRRHFAEREKEPHKTAGFPWFGQSYPKRYFWRGTHGDSVSERTSVTLSSPSRLEGRVTIASPALAHKLDPYEPEIKPTGGRKYLAIPASPIAARWDGMPRDFPGGLRFAFSKLPDGHWLPSLVAASRHKVRGQKGEENAVCYWLVHKVKTRYDANALPTAEAQTTAVTAAVRAAVQRILARRPSASRTP